jgi:hypothetical protein
MIDRLSKRLLPAGIALSGLILAAALTTTGLPGTPAFAQGTPEQQAACEPDATRLCSEFIPDERTTASCLRRNLRKLSPACRSVMAKAKRSKRRIKRR